jgi:hypothetical protein
MIQHHMQSFTPADTEVSPQKVVSPEQDDELDNSDADQTAVATPTSEEEDANNQALGVSHGDVDKMGVRIPAESSSEDDEDGGAPVRPTVGGLRLPG